MWDEILDFLLEQTDSASFWLFAPWRIIAAVLLVAGILWLVLK